MYIFEYVWPYMCVHLKSMHVFNTVPSSVHSSVCVFIHTCVSAFLCVCVRVRVSVV